ncbi:hypothetical protein [Nocardia sp. NPDC057668]|uniref:hypothetical protein n=1 Tax=Nocardia sp. NPDC057668 TaxID=3346202 RepID=UPI00366E2B59
MEIVVESAPLATECGRCRAAVRVVVRDVLDGDARWWSLEGECPECGTDRQESAYGPPPAGFRAAMLAMNGTTRLRIATGSLSIAGAMRVLRRAEALSMADARAGADELLAEGSAGTRVEMEVLARQLRADGAIVEIEPGPGAGSAAAQSIRPREVHSVAAPTKIGEQADSFEAVPGTLTADDVARMLRYLRSATVIVVAASRAPDPFALGRPGARVGIGVVTDGEWEWPLAWEDYVGTHAVAPPAEFMAHAAARGWIAPELPEARVLEFARRLGIPEGDE